MEQGGKKEKEKKGPGERGGGRRERDMEGRTGGGKGVEEDGTAGEWENVREGGEKTEDEKGAQEEDLKVAGGRWEEYREERGRESKGEVRKTVV